MLRGRKILIFALLIAVAVLFSACDAGGDDDGQTDGAFPSKQITFISGSAPGGAIDTYARALGGTMPKYLPGSGAIIVDYVLDPAGLRCPQHMWDADPDGYTITGLFVDSVLLRELEHPEVDWELKGFTPIAGITQVYRCVAVPADSPYETIEDLKNADKLIFGTMFGTSPYLVSKLFAEEFDIDASFVGYEGYYETLVALMRGDVDAVIHIFAETLPFVEAGDVKVLAYLSEEPDPDSPYPDIPTAGEAGLEFLSSVANDPFVYFGPPGMDEDVVEVLRESIECSLGDEDLIAWSKKVGRPLHYSSPEQVVRDMEQKYVLYEEYQDIFTEQ